MTILDNRIANFVIGDDLEVIRIVTDIVSGTILTKAWLTVKANLSDLDGAALIQKIINSGLAPDIGQITNVGLSGSGTLVFDLTEEDTDLLTPLVRYPYDIQVMTSDNRITTLEIGKMQGAAGVTFAEN